MPCMEFYPASADADRRPADPVNRHVDFSPVLDSVSQTSPSLRLAYLYLSYLAKDAPFLNPRLRPTTAEGKKWVPDTWKRKRADSSAKNTHSDGDDELGDDNDEDHHHDVSRSDDETDTDESYAGPSAHTRSKVATAKTSQKHSQLNDSSKQQLVSTMPGYAADTSQAYMAHLPRLHRDELNIGRAMRFGPDCVVSM